MAGKDKTDWPACRQRLTQGMATLLHEPVSATLTDQLITYLQALARWNKAYNLTAVRDPEAMVTRHILDCLAIAEFVVGPRLVDVGSGPGLPGIVLALARPELAVTLVEANRKKAIFLRHVRRELGLDNITVQQARVEAVSRETTFDDMTTRAFASAAQTLHYAGHLLSRHGRLVLMKGRDPAEELVALPNGFVHRATQAIRVPGLDAQRHAVIIERQCAQDVPE